MVSWFEGASLRVATGPLTGGLAQPTTLTATARPEVPQALAMNTRGGAVIAWTENNGVFGARMTATVWTAPQLLDVDGFRPAAAIDAASVATVAWVSQCSSGCATDGIRATRSGGPSWPPPVLLSPRTPSTGIPFVGATSPSATVVWSESGVARPELRSATWAFGAWQPVTTSATAVNFPMSFALGPRGDGYVFWNGGTTFHFRYAR